MSTKYFFFISTHFRKIGIAINYLKLKKFQYLLSILVVIVLTKRQKYVVCADQSQNFYFFFVIGERSRILQHKRRKPFGGLVTWLREFEFLRHGHLLFEIRPFLLVPVRVIRVHTTCSNNNMIAL